MISKALTAISLAAIFLGGCITQEKCLEKFPPTVKDSSFTKETNTSKTDTSWLPREKILIKGDSIPCPDVKYHREEKKGNLKAVVHIENGKVDFLCAADSLMNILTELRKEIITNRTKTETPKPIIEYRTNWYDMAARWASGVLLFLWLLTLLIMRKRNV